MDTILIEDLEVFYHVGVPDAERAEPQRLLLTLELTTDFTAAAAKDDLRWSIDYELICRRLREFGERRSWQLIETVAVELAEVILREFKPLAVQLEIKKFILPRTRHVAVRVSRSQ